MAEPKGNDAVVYVPDDRRVTLGRYTAGNWKVGAGGVYSYSRYPGLSGADNGFGTCPGSTPVCRSMCYAMRLADNPLLNQVYAMNGEADVPPVPEDAWLVRWHVSGDFDSREYVENWIQVVADNHDVEFFGYTRSWRVTSAMLPALKALRDEPNVTLFASVDPGTPQEVIDGLHKDGWRVARIATQGINTPDDEGVVCLEERGIARDCVDCGFCFGDANSGADVIFIEH
jgi:hypothetical protein